jgi:hypothetical protein
MRTAVGAVIALMPFHTQFDIIAMIGMLLLVGIVQKNGIMTIDFALAYTWRSAMMRSPPQRNGPTTPARARDAGSAPMTGPQPVFVVS